MSKMIRLDQVEEILNKMNDKIALQESQILNLQVLCSQLLSKSKASESFESVQRSLIDINNRLDTVQEASTSKMGLSEETHLTAGELAYLNSIEIQNLMN